MKRFINVHMLDDSANPGGIWINIDAIRWFTVKREGVKEVGAVIMVDERRFSVVEKVAEVRALIGE